MMMTIAPMHKDVHERASSNYQERQDRRQMSAMPDRQITAHESGEAQHDPALIRPNSLLKKV
jgi:hypothetical protein